MERKPQHVMDILGNTAAIMTVNKPVDPTYYIPTEQDIVNRTIENLPKIKCINEIFLDSNKRTGTKRKLTRRVMIHVTDETTYAVKSKGLLSYSNTDVHKHALKARIYIIEQWLAITIAMDKHRNKINKKGVYVVGGMKYQASKARLDADPIGSTINQETLNPPNINITSQATLCLDIGNMAEVIEIRLDTQIRATLERNTSSIATIDEWIFRQHNPNNGIGGYPRKPRPQSRNKEVSNQYSYGAQGKIMDRTFNTRRNPSQRNQQNPWETQCNNTRGRPRSNVSLAQERPSGNRLNSQYSNQPNRRNNSSQGRPARGNNIKFRTFYNRRNESN
jgi:hypothetical protein